MRTLVQNKTIGIKAKNETSNLGHTSMCREECELIQTNFCKDEYAVLKNLSDVKNLLPLLSCADLPGGNTLDSLNCFSIEAKAKIEKSK